MALRWTSDHAELHHARVLIADRIDLQIESLGWRGWDWEVWTSNGRVKPRYGRAKTFKAAQAEAEKALAELYWELKLIQSALPAQP